MKHRQVSSTRRPSWRKGTRSRRALPLIVLMAFGMSPLFVTTTLVAVHGIPSEKSRKIDKH